MDTTAIFLSVAALVGGAVTIIGALIAVYKIARRIDDAIGVDSQGRTISDRLGRVEHQLWENGGSSLADRVNKIEATASATATELSLIKEFIVTGTIATAEQPVKKVRAVRKKAS
jgi:helix-turn-helix protein